jgi:hypothetical protein
MNPGPPVDQGGPPGQPPMGGAGGASMPTPDAGAEETAMAGISVVVELLTKILGGVGAQSEIGMEILPMLQKLAKLSPMGAGSPGVERTELRNMMMQRQQQPNPMLQQMQAQGAA